MITFKEIKNFLYWHKFIKISFSVFCLQISILISWKYYNIEIVLELSYVPGEVFVFRMPFVTNVSAKNENSPRNEKCMYSSIMTGAATKTTWKDDSGDMREKIEEGCKAQCWKIVFFFLPDSSFRTLTVQENTKMIDLNPLALFSLSLFWFYHVATYFHIFTNFPSTWYYKIYIFLVPSENVLQHQNENVIFNKHPNILRKRSYTWKLKGEGSKKNIIHCILININLFSQKWDHLSLKRV